MKYLKPIAGSKIYLTLLHEVKTVDLRYEDGSVYTDSCP